MAVDHHRWDLERALEADIDAWEAQAKQFLDHDLENGWTDLSLISRVYADFFCPAFTAFDLERDLEASEFRVLFIGAHCDPTFVHARCENIWKYEELLKLTRKLFELGTRHGAGSDGWFIISVEEDDE